jgi:hypothetical protein
MRLEQDVEPLVRAQQPEEQDDRPVHRGELGRQARVAGRAQHAVRDDLHLVGGHAEPVHEPAAAVLGVHDHGVDTGVEAALGGALPGPWLARQHVVGGEHERPPECPQEQPVHRLDREPLEVHDGRRARGARRAEHVRDVAGELGRHAQAPGGHAAVEALVDRVAGAARDVAVGEAAREQAHVGAGRGQGGGERVVVRRRVGRGIDDVDAHGA